MGSPGVGGSLSAASDVYFNNPTQSDTITYNNTLHKWTNAQGSATGSGNVRFYTGSAWQPRGASPYPVTFDAGLTDPVSQPTDWLPGDHIISLNPPVAP